MARKTGKPNKTRERGVGVGGVFAAGLAILNVGLDWISRGQTVMTLYRYVDSPWLQLVLIGLATALIIYATKLEQHREDDETPRIITLETREPAKPKRHWRWLKLAAVAAAFSIVLALVIFAWLHHSYAHRKNQATIAKSTTNSTSLSAHAQAPSLSSKQSTNSSHMPSMIPKRTQKNPIHPLVQPPPRSNTKDTTPLSSPPSIPSTSTPEDSSSLPPSPVFKPYGELKQIYDQITTLNQGWQTGIQEINQDFARPYKTGRPGPMPHTLPDELAQRLSDEDSADTDRYENLQSQIQKAHNDAVAYMKLTPNQVKNDAQDFQQANSQALTRTSIVNLEANTPNLNRFSKILDYLAKLLKQLGDYH